MFVVNLKRRFDLNLVKHIFSVTKEATHGSIFHMWLLLCLKIIYTYFQAHIE